MDEKRYQVFVSSTYEDLKDERLRIIKSLLDIDCFPAGMEMFAASDDEQFAFISRVIDECDYYVVVLAGKYGSLTDEGTSFTEKEFDYALSKKIPILAFLHENLGSLPRDKCELDEERCRKLESFREKLRAERLVKTWLTPEELAGHVVTSLVHAKKTHPRPGWVRAGDHPNATELLTQLNEVRQENESLKKQLHEASQKQLPADLDLAGMDATFSLTLWNYLQSDTDLHQLRRPMQATWTDLFKAIAADMFDGPDDSLVSHRIAASLLHSRNRERVHNPELVHESAHVAYDDFVTIRVQFVALGLVQVERGEGANGRTMPFWSLTTRGEQLMMQLCTVKAEAVS